MWRWLRASVVVLAACSAGEPPSAPAAHPPPVAAPTLPHEDTDDDTPEAPGAVEPADEPAPSPATPHEGACATGEACLEQALQARRRGQPREAVEALRNGCELGHAASCYRLGVAHRDGDGVEADEAHAADLFREACAADHQAACDALGH